MILHYNSSINWCEPDYVYFSFIAEFWNSISGLSLIYSSYYFKKNKFGKYKIQIFFKRQKETTREETT